MSAIITPMYATVAPSETTVVPEPATPASAAPADHPCECEAMAANRQRTANIVLLLYGLIYLLIVIALLKYILF